MGVLLLIALLPILAAQPDRFGQPACEAPHMELARRTGFVLCHDSSRKVALWTLYELTPQQLEADVLPRASHFRPDNALTLPGATDADYRHSGFHRGHLVPARDLANSRETFLLSNAAPQNPSLNMGRWRELEAKVRSLAADSEAVYIVTGTLTATEADVIGPGRVAIPTHFFKAILAVRGSSKRMFAVLMPNTFNRGLPLDHFAVSVDEIELSTGLDLFSSLDDEEESQLECTANTLS